MNLSQRIKTEKIKRGWSIRKLSDESGVKYNTVRDIVNNTTENPRKDNLEKIAKTLNIEVIERSEEDKELEKIFNDVRKLNKDVREDILEMLKIWLKRVKK